MIIPHAERLKGISSYYFARKLSEIGEMNNDGGPAVINLGIGSPDLEPPEGVTQALRSALNKDGAHKYQSYKGIPELRAAFSMWYHRNYKVDINPETEILPLIGSKEGIMHLSMSFLNPGDKVLIPNPGYPAYHTITRLCQAIPVPYKLSKEKNWLPDLENLEQSDLSKVKMMWINYPHMPTGAKADMPFFKDIVEFGKRNNILICHDNPYAHILNEDPVSIMQVSGAINTVVELTSLSKHYNMAGWRIGAMVASEEVINTVMKFKTNMDSGMFRPIQEAAVEALHNSDEWFGKLNEAYAGRRELAWSIMELLDCNYSKDSAGLFTWGRIPEKYRDSESLIEEILHNARVFITPGHIFGDEGDRYIRISLCADVLLLSNALKRIEHNVVSQSTST